MLAALTTYIKTSHNGDKLDAQVMNDMYANENAPFTGDVGSSGKNLKSKTYSHTQNSIVALFTEIDTVSGKTVVAADGIAGLVTGASRTVLVNAKGQEYAQLIDKGLMGSCFYYQGTSKYLADNEDGIGDAVNNTDVEEGKGTDKEHHFDEAFGYFGVPIDFPTNTEGVAFWGKYSNKRDGVVETNKIMDAFLKGRAAISAKDKVNQDAAVAEIKVLWEKVSAATAIHYLNEGIETFADDADRIHVLSEALAFIQAFGYNTGGTISMTDANEVLALLGDNFWSVGISDIEAARDLLATKAGLEDKKLEL
jgi:hypothetical protein